LISFDWLLVLRVFWSTGRSSLLRIFSEAFSELCFFFCEEDDDALTGVPTPNPKQASLRTTNTRTLFQPCYLPKHENPVFFSGVYSGRVVRSVGVELEWLLGDYGEDLFTPRYQTSVNPGNSIDISRLSLWAILLLPRITVVGKWVRPTPALPRFVPPLPSQIIPTLCTFPFFTFLACLEKPIFKVLLFQDTYPRSPV